MSWKNIVLKTNENISIEQEKIKNGWVMIYFKNGKGYGKSEWKYGVKLLHNDKEKEIDLYTLVKNHENYKLEYDKINGQGSYEKIYGNQIESSLLDEKEEEEEESDEDEYKSD
uniref:Uncharacterized protein n=1 Tax=viral metagenome TaxID=1070528 RepID=A0A6C0H5T8_9ZZZZ